MLHLFKRLRLGRLVTTAYWLLRFKGAFRSGVVMIPAVIGDLQERSSVQSKTAQKWSFQWFKRSYRRHIIRKELIQRYLLKSADAEDLQDLIQTLV